MVIITMATEIFQPYQGLMFSQPVALAPKFNQTLTTVLSQLKLIFLSSVNGCRWHKHMTMSDQKTLNGRILSSNLEEFSRD